MGYTKCLDIINRIKTTITAPVIAQVPTMEIVIDEPVNLVFSELPNIAIYPMTEQFIYAESFNQNDRKQLMVRVELRMKGGPSSQVCTPVVNTICAAIKADRTLGGLVTYVEIQMIQWANEQTGSGVLSGSAIDIQVNYFA